MMGYGGGIGGGMFFGLLMMVGLIVLVVVLVRVMGGGFRRGDGGGTEQPARPRGRPESQARQRLDERYARGELNTEEYQERLRVLGESG